MSLSRNTVAERVDQLVGKGKNFIAYSLAVDESMDTSDIAQLSIFVHGVHSNLSIKEEFLALCPMHGTTAGQDLNEEVSRCVMDMGLNWKKLMGVTTEGAPAMCGHRSGLVAGMQEVKITGELTAYHCIIHQESLCDNALKMDHVMSTITRAINTIRANGLNHRQFKVFLGEFATEYGDLLYHTEERWLSQGMVLQRCFVRRSVCSWKDKGKDTTELRDELFLCDITSHLNVMNLQLQGRGRFIFDMYSTVKAFKTQLSLWETQMRKENLSHFLNCQTMKEKFADKFNILAEEAHQLFE